jgi:hypothetical protein
MRTAAAASRRTVLLVLAFCTLAGLDTDRAADTGRVLEVVAAHRARTNYDAAAAELRGYLERWRAAGLDRPDIEAELARMHDLLRQMVEMQELVQRADSDAGAAHEYLQRVTRTAQPSMRAAEQARALRALAKHDPRVRELLRRAFPARLIVSINGEVPMDDLVVIPLTNAAVEMSQVTGLQIWGAPRRDGGEMAVIKVQILVEQNDVSRNGILAGTGMRSYAFMVSARWVDDEKRNVAAVATTQNVLGISAANAARFGTEKLAMRLYEELIDSVAKRVALGMV